MENNNLKIQILGPGCASCKKLFELTKRAVQELGITTEVEYVTDIQKIISMGVMSSPVLAINEKVAIAGQVPNLEKIKELLTNCNKPSENNSTGACSCGGKC